MRPQPTIRIVSSAMVVVLARRARSGVSWITYVCASEPGGELLSSPAAKLLRDSHISFSARHSRAEGSPRVRLRRPEDRLRRSLQTREPSRIALYAAFPGDASRSGRLGDERRPAEGGPYAIANDLAIAAKNAAAKLRLGGLQRAVARFRPRMTPILWCWNDQSPRCANVIAAKLWGRGGQIADASRIAPPGPLASEFGVHTSAQA